MESGESNTTDKTWYETKTKRSIAIIFLLLVGVFIGASFDNLYDYSVTENKPSPQTRIHRSQIHVYDDKIVIDITNPSLSGFTDTKSMDPALDAGMNGITIKPRSRDDIQVGDIISYTKNETLRITHRVIQKGWDDDGWYVYTQGDNNRYRDFEKVRWWQVKTIQIGVIY